MSNDIQPEIRFPGFTEAWEQRKLSDILILIGGNAFSSSDSTTEGIPWLKIANVDKNGIDWSTQSFLPSEYWGEFPNYQLNKGDYVMALTRPILNHTLKIGKVDKPALLNQRVAKLDFSLDKEFTFQLLQRRTVVDKIDNELAGTDPPNLGSKNLTNIDILITNNKGEQQKIGTFFKQLDNIIALHQRKLDLLKETKKGFLQKMFPKNGAKVPEIRFPGFTEDWEERKLQEVLRERNNQQPQSTEYPLVSFTVENGVTPKTDRYEREQLVVGDKSSKKYKVTVLNDIVYNPANLKFGAISRNKYGNAVFSPIYITFLVNNDVTTPEFIEMFVTRNDFIKRALKYQQGTVYERQSVSPTDLLAMNVYLPGKSEQEKIGSFFQQLDETIALHQRKLDLLKETKKGFLQKMFV
ncbi:restriction endonuclease subunit S [Enterococcus faecium]|uniref:restriction endonuclease subunit S n=3 Tax=Enterococcus faecium TaxID=1352 RepID=UPI000CF21F8A|nr:restriction endonuclease subunit S [Enterococcus faecium]MBD9714408.1 restriction endonuclease subunit S [Enterococcus faecium]MBD9755898.1 restriction endonuclease subunit S [Enterococcus faecium]PQF30242.1 restriction endonuclease subunit S [Enterococcus faecium]PQF58611.1 restriction endonuclease subunit S [Enterococcus faecium]RBS52649.1 hypothetical protein EB27_02360 [Enterococcus faecium]